MLYNSDVWPVSEARKALADVIEAASRGPQRIERRGRLVAVVLGPADYRAFRSWQERRRGSVEALADLRTICAQQGYELHVPERRDRDTPFE